MSLSFVKYVGAGNDFLLFDNTEGTFPILTSFIQRLCHRHKGIGADGLILLEPSSKGHFRMRIFNRDGSEAEMCGNGLRCFVKWLIDLGHQKEPFLIEVSQEVLQVSQIGHTICVKMSNPHSMEWNLLLESAQIDFLNTGVPHAVLFVDDIETIDLQQLAPSIRYHPRWMPQGTNVTYAQRLQNGQLTIRTYERGVEGETLACGTGATAAAIALHHRYGDNSPIVVHTKSNEELLVQFSSHKEQFFDVSLTGSAEYVFRGEISF